jgi:hypothetical protein
VKSNRRNGGQLGGSFFVENKPLKSKLSFLDLRKMTQEVNRLYIALQQQNILSKVAAKSTRKARTRTLIQLGGLLDKAGITAKFNIILGEDLQSNVMQMDKASIVFGFLMEALNTIDDTTQTRIKWKNIGTKSFKYQ